MTIFTYISEKMILGLLYISKEELTLFLLIIGHLFSKKQCEIRLRFKMNALMKSFNDLLMFHDV